MGMIKLASELHDALRAEARAERRSARAQLNRILEDRYADPDQTAARRAGIESMKRSAAKERFAGS